MSQADGSIIIDTRIDQTGLKTGLGEMKSAVVKSITAVTAAIGAASVAVIKLGSDFEQANAKASTLFGDAQVNMTQYQGKMLELSNKTGLAATELGNTMYDALSAGIPASDDMSDALGFLEKNTKLAKAGFTDINTATTATAKVLNAYKMDVSETDKIHKVLIQTQNKGITTVNELGSVLSQVTPTAAAMSVSFEQVGAALANMTAQGTPTAQATTQLNQLFAELGKKGTTGQKGLEAAAEGTKYAGKSFQALMKEGVPLNEVIDLMSTYADKNGLSMIDMFSSIEAGKAALSVSGKNAQQYTENLKAMKTEVDVVGNAYDKVTDTFKEKSAKVVNSLKNVGIAAYSKFEKPLKKSMDVAQDSVDELSKNMSNGRLGESVDKIAEAFGDLIEVTTKLATKAIPMIVDGFAFIVDHGKELTAILGAVGTAMGAMKAYDFTQTTIMPMVNAFGKAKQVTQDFAYAQQAATAFGLDYNDTLTAGQSIVGLLTGNVSLATTATTLWSGACTALGGPLGVGVTLVTALSAAIVILNGDMDDEKARIKELNKETKERVDAYNELLEKQKEQVTTNLAEIDHTQRLSDELMSLVDANGKVKEGYEGRVSFILGELNSALGTEYEMNDGIIAKYGELKKSINDLIATQRAQIILESQKEAYTDAIKNHAEELKRLTDLENEYTQLKIQNDAKIAELEEQRDAAARSGDEALRDSINSKIESLNYETNTLKDTLEDQRSLVDTHNNTIAQYEADAAAVKSGNLEAMSVMNARYTSSYVENGKTINLELQQRVTNEKANLESLQRERNKAMQISDEKERQYQVAMIDVLTQASQQKLDAMMQSNGKTLSQYGSYIQERITKAKELKEGLDKNEKGITQDMVTEAQKQTVQSLVEYGEYVNSKNQKAIDLQNKLDRHEKGITENMVKEARNQATKASKEFQQVANNVTNALGDLPDDTRKIFSNMVYPMYNEMEKAKPSLWSQAASIADGILSNLRHAFDIHSPSRKTRDIFKNVMLGAEKGMADEAGSILKQTDDIANGIMSKLSNIDISDMLNTIRSAIYAEQSKMGVVVDAQAKSEILKTSLSKVDLSSMTATLKGIIENHIVIDGRETAVVLAPLVSEEIAFRGR